MGASRGAGPVQAVLFDLDGTLLDTLADLGNAVNRVLARNGFATHDLDDYRDFIGRGARTLIERALPEDRRDNATVARCLAEYMDDYGRNWNVDTRAYPGVPEMLDRLAARSIPFAVLSNKPHDFTRLCVATLLDRWTFALVLGQRDGLPHKPHPAGALEVAAHLHIAPARFLYVGDSGVDMQTACAAGMIPVGVLWGFRPMEELRSHGARALLHKPQDLLPLLDRAP